MLRILLTTGLLSVSLAFAQVEPSAGSWKTWVIGSGNQFRPAIQPNSLAELSNELSDLKAQIAALRNDNRALQNALYWGGNPVSRWNDIGVNFVSTKGGNNLRVLTYLNIALYDAMIATWDAKYTFNRPRPSKVDPSIKVIGTVPDSPSYPDERAVAAGAASSILSLFYPNEAANLENMTQEAGRSSITTGIAYPSDVVAGFELGKKVAAAVIARIKSDGSDYQWDGKMPSGPGLWTGTNPVNITMPHWKPWVIKSADQFRPGPPPTFDSDQKKAEMAELKTLMANRTPVQTEIANFWQFGAGGSRGIQFWMNWISQKLPQYGWDTDPPRAARAYALAVVTLYDANIACYEAKYTYWTARPFQLDPEIKTLFPTPNHPSYPSAHACGTGATTLVMSGIFPTEAADLSAMEKEVNESRIWAGIHVRSDIEGGRVIARGVSGAVLDWAKQDGSK